MISNLKRIAGLAVFLAYLHGGSVDAQVYAAGGYNPYTGGSARVAGMPDAPPETRARLVRLAGGDAGAQRAISRASADLIAAREVKLATATAKPAAGDAEFMLLVNEAGKVEASRYWSGDRKLEPLAAALSKAVLPFTFPADTPMRVPVLVSASCPARGECDVFLSATDRLVTSSP